MHVTAVLSVSIVVWLALFEDSVCFGYGDSIYVFPHPLCFDVTQSDPNAEAR